MTYNVRIIYVIRTYVIIIIMYVHMNMYNIRKYLYLLGSFQKGDPVLIVLFNSSTNGQDIWIENDVIGVECKFFHQQIV